MTADFARRPLDTEHAPYYSRYVSCVPDGDVPAFLRRQADVVAARFAAVVPERETFAYEPGKWSIRQVLGHMSDTERVFAYRALQFARLDPAPLPSMDQDVFMAESRFASRPLASILLEFASVRAATLSLLDSLVAEDLDRSGVASGHPVTVRALAWIIAGHAQHHLGVLKDRYNV